MKSPDRRQAKEASPAKDVKSEPGRVITFYSYKGGVGRSLALANVAALLARWGKRVLVIDWDLEAPGIEKYFEPDSPERQPLLDRRKRPLAAARAKTPGVVDLVLAFRDGTPLDWRDCLIRVESIVDDQTITPIDILTAGRDVPEYAGRLRGINWEALFENHDFGVRLEEWRQAWIDNYDFVLVDSRTGITDIGGICTIHLPDVLVALFTTNEQSVAGVKQVMAQARTAQESLPVGRFRLSLVPVPARDESVTEHVLSHKWRDVFARELGPFYESWLPEGLTPRDVLERLKIPYKAYWSFGERIPALLAGVDDPASPGHAYNLLAKLLASGLDLRSEMDSNLRATVAEREVQTTKNRTRRVVSYLFSGMIVVLALGVVVAAWLSKRADVEARFVRVNSIVAAVESSPDPVEQALLLQELNGLPETPKALELAKGLLTQFPNPAVVIRGETSEASPPRFSADGKHLSTVSRSRLRVWTTDGRGAPSQWSVTTRCSARWSPIDDRLALLCEAPGSSGMIELPSKEMHDLKAGPESLNIHCGGFSPDGKSLLLCTDASLVVANVRTGKLVHDVFSPYSPTAMMIHWAEFMENGWGIALARKQLPIERRTLDMGVSSGAFPVPDGWSSFEGVLHSEDRARLAVYRGNQIAIWPMDSSLTAPEVVDVGKFEAIDISRDSIAVVNDGILRVINRVGTVRPFGTKRVRWVQFDKSGSQVLAGADDGSVMGTLLPEHVFYTLRHPSFASSGFFSPDGKQIVTVVPADGSVRIWKFDRPPAAPSNWPDALRMLREYTTACLLPRERTKFLAETPEVARAKYEACEKSYDRPPLADKDLEVKSASGSTGGPW